MKRKREADPSTEEAEEAPRISSEPRVVFVLEDAPLQKGLVRKKWKILSASKDKDFLQKQQKNPDEHRPDIVHEALCCILDSPLNKKGMVRAVYVRLHDGVLFEVKPHVRIPRSCERFCGPMLDLLQKSCVRTPDGGQVLLRVLEGPVTRHLPANSRVIGLSHGSKKKADLEEYASAIRDDLNLVFVIGGMVRGSIKQDYTDDIISVSDHQLSTEGCLSRVCEALEQVWNVH